MGDVTLINVLVTNNNPSNNTPVLGPITLAPGASANFTGSFIAPMDCCEITDTVSARGQDICAGTTVTATASDVCPLLSLPRIAVAMACPGVTTPVGGRFSFLASVTNTGDVNLTNVFVYAPQVAGGTKLLGPIELAPGESERFSGSYIVVAASNPASDAITATGMDTCQARLVTAKANCSGPVTLFAALMLNSITLSEGVATITWSSEPGVKYTLQCKGNTQDPIWIDIPGTVSATGSTASKTDKVGPTPHRLYRVIVTE